MYINNKFIEDVVTSFHKNVQESDIQCENCQGGFEIERYKDDTYQKLYALRYLPAYYFEYCILAEQLNERAKKSHNNLNILSLGCGLSPDYYALRDNLNGVDFQYVGIDATEWSSQNLMPPKDDNFEFHMENVSNIPDALIEKVDVFIFPKSIGDIDSSTGIESLADRIAHNGKKRVYFLNSYISKSLNSPMDIEIFKKVHVKLLNSGYTTNDNPHESFYRHDGITKDRPIGLRKIDGNFVYPDGFSLCCDNSDNSKECSSCMIKSPILTNAYMAFSLLEYEKK